MPLREGTIQVGGTLLDISTIDVVRRQIAWIPQELALPFEWVKDMIDVYKRQSPGRARTASRWILPESSDGLSLYP